MKRRFLWFVVIAQCATATVFESKSADYRRDEAEAKYHRPASVPYPTGNKYTPARADLGKKLFFDPRLSGANSIACASCHNPGFSWGDGLPKAVGFGSKELGRRSPTILNTAFGQLMFWDGRAGSLEEQAVGPIKSSGEMNMPLEKMLEKLALIPGYAPMFEQAYPGEGVTEQTVAKAIATFERGVISGPAPFDEWIAGSESAISDSAKRGFDLFNTTANCAKCHTGWNFTDDDFHDIGLADDDLGRGKIQPEIAGVQHAFKTPTLRNIALRAPYMHNGSEKTLEDVIELYSVGGRLKRPSLAHQIRPLTLTANEKNDLCNFLRTLNGNDRPVEIPTLPR